jgi:acetyl esterase/lipase
MKIKFFLYGCILISEISYHYARAQSPIDFHPSIPIDTTYTVWSTNKKLIKQYPFIKEPDSFHGDLKVFENVVYQTLNTTPFGKGDLHVDVFIPNRNKKTYPAVLLVHGGGWRAGNKNLNTPMAQRLAAHGYIVVSVEYRLSLEAKYPVAIHDLKAAIRWMRANAKKYHIDEKQIAIAGSSAGGQLASLIGVTNQVAQFKGTLENEKFSSAVQAVIDLDGLLDFTNEESLVLDRNENSADVFWLEGFYEDNKTKWQEASALHWVNKKSPPFLFINSSQTRFHAGCKEMVDKLNEFGVYSQVIKLEDAPHSYWLFEPWLTPTVEYMAKFLDEVFKNGKS